MRNKIIPGLFLLVLAFFVPPIEVKCQSISLNVGYPHYFMSDNSYSTDVDLKNNFNYIFEISASKYFKKSSVDLGYSFSTKNYVFNFSSGELSKINKNLNYHTIPFSFNYQLYSTNKDFIAGNLGIKFIKADDITEEWIYRNGSNKLINNDDIELKWGKSISFGIQYKRLCSSNLIVSVKTFCDAKIILEYYEGGRGEVLTDDKISVGATIGVEWLFLKDLPYFKK